MNNQQTRSTKASPEKPSILISGASFAGLSTAFWMSRLGYAVTVVEVGKGLKKGGSPVDIRDSTVDIVRRMCLLEQIQAISLKPRPVMFLDNHGIAVASMLALSEEAPALEYEVERDALLQILFNQIENDVQFIFDDRIQSLTQSADDVAITFKSGNQRTFSLVFGCDGNHSAVRKMCFGPESAYSHSLDLYFSITIVDKLLILEDTTQIYNVPGKAVMLNAYNNKTDIVFCFYSDNKISCDYRDQAQQRQLILRHFESEGWRTRELLAETSAGDRSYFDQMCQIKMPSWVQGRVALVGDAGYCASPAAGMGGSLAIVGATALADACQQHPNDYKAAFQEYDRSLRPFVEKVQANAIEFGLDTFAPRSEEAIHRRNDQLNRLKVS